MNLLTDTTLVLTSDRAPVYKYLSTQRSRLQPWFFFCVELVLEWYPQSLSA